MKLHEKVKYYREANQMSQEKVALRLGLNQSQYSRREKGDIKFNSEEIDLLGQLFRVNPSELFGDHTVILNNKDQQGGNFAQYIAIPDDLIKQYEARIKEKDEMIKLLKEQISQLKNES